MDKTQEYRRAGMTPDTEDVPEPTLGRLVNEQTDLLSKLDEALGDLAIHFEPIMRDDPRQKVEPTVKKGGQPLLLELVEANNWRIERAIGDVMAMKGLSGL